VRLPGKGTKGIHLESNLSDRIRHMLAVFLLGMTMWLGLTGSVAREELVAGILVALVATILVSDRSPVFAGLRFSPAAPLHLVRYLFVFTIALWRANLDMARRVLSPVLPIRPAVVEVQTDLASDLGRLMLANSITLTPGTLTVDINGDLLLVHWIDCPSDVDLSDTTRAIAADFERHLKGFLY